MRKPLGILILAAGLGMTALLAAGPALAANPPMMAPRLPAAEIQEIHKALNDAINTADSFVDRYEAAVWLTAQSNRLERYMPDAKARMYLLKAVHREATRAQLSPDLVLAVIQIESRFDRYAVSSAGAQGLMQVMPFWKHEIGRPNDNLADTDTNLRYGCQILRYYLDKERNRVYPALARYNGSQGKAGYPNKVVDAWKNRWYAGNI